MVSKSRLLNASVEEAREVFKPKKKERRRKLHPHDWQPSDEDRERVEVWSAEGIAVASQAKMMKCSRQVFVKKFREEIEYGKDVCNAKIAERLFKCANSDVDNATTFNSRKTWLSAKAGWRENSAVEVSGKDGKDLMTPVDKAQRMGHILTSNPDIMKKLKQFKKDKEMN